MKKILIVPIIILLVISVAVAGILPPTSFDGTIYPLLLGRSGGQTIIGGTDANDDITIKGTSHSTKTTSYVLLQPDGGNVGIGTTAPATDFELYSADDGNTGKIQSFYQNSASPASNDALGRLSFYGKDNTNAKQLYSYIDGAINVNTGRGKIVFNLRTTGGTYKQHSFTDTVVSLADGLISTSSSTPFVTLGSSTSGQSGHSTLLNGTLTPTSGISGFARVSGAYQGTGTSGLEAFLIDPTMTSGGSGGWTMMKINPSADTGTGTKNLIWAGYGSTAKFVVEKDGLVSNGVQAVTCTENGSPSTLTITPASSYIEITNQDAEGCNITMGETGMTAGMVTTICVVSNAGGNVTFADTSGVTQLAGAFAADIDDCITMRYGAGTTWREVSRSAN